MDSAIHLLNKVSLGIENADSLDVMNSNRKFDVLLDGTLVCTNLSSESTLRERKQLPVAIFDVRDVNVLFMWDLLYSPLALMILDYYKGMERGDLVQVFHFEGRTENARVSSGYSRVLRAGGPTGAATK